MAFLLDTSALSDLVRGDATTRKHLAQLAAQDHVFLVPIVRGEILFGIERLPPGRKRKDLQARATKWLDETPCTPLPEDAGDVYANLKAKQQLKGLILDENDLWIAAAALHFNATLVSRDRDFSRIDGLDVVDWSADEKTA